MSNDLDRREFHKSASLLAASLVTGSLIPAAEAQTADSAYYSLSEKVEDLHIPDAVTVIGIGGSGSWPALFSAMCGVKSLLITDMARVEAMDLGRTPYRPGDIGRLKTEALTEIIHLFRPDVSIQTNTRRLEVGDSDLFHGRVLFNGVDYKPLTEWLPKAAKDHGMKYVHGFYYGRRVGVTTSELPDIKYVPGREVPVWIGSSALAGCLSVLSAFSTPLEYFGDLSELSMKPQAINAMFADGASGGA